MYEGRAVIAVLGPRDAPVDAGEIPLAKPLGAALAGAGYGLAILGAGGAPSAAAESALTAGGRVVAIAAPEMPVPDLDQEPGVFETQTEASYFAALEACLDLSDAVVILHPELSSMGVLLHVWSYGCTLDGPYRPLILVGDGWPKIVKALADAADLDRRTRAMVTFANTAEEAVESLRYYVQPA